MKHHVLALLFVLFATVCIAQEYEEMVFEVKKPKIVPPKAYFYKELPTIFRDNPWNSSGYNTCIKKVGDTLFYYAFNREIKRTKGNYNTATANYQEDIDITKCYYALGQKDTGGLRYLGAYIYTNVNDTIWEKFISRQGWWDLTAFCTYDTLITGSKRPKKEDRFREVDTRLRQAYVIDSNVEIKVQDTLYVCMKVLVSYYTKSERASGKASLKMNMDKGWAYSRTYYYLRKSDYLPLKIETLDRVKKLHPYSFYSPDPSPFELYKAIE